MLWIVLLLLLLSWDKMNPNELSLKYNKTAYCFIGLYILSSTSLF
jgi:hypothetical protein